MAKILLADDDALIGEVVSHMLRENDHHITVVDSGDKVLPAVQQDKPELIILDNLMPGLKGIEVLVLLQKNAITADIPVIMLTAQIGRNHMIEAYGAGATDYLTKPFDPPVLISRVSSALGITTDDSPSRRVA